MAKIVSILVRCDACASAGDVTDAAEITVNINGTGTYELDLCPRHTGEYLAPLQTLINKSGVLRVTDDEGEPGAAPAAVSPAPAPAPAEPLPAPAVPASPAPASKATPEPLDMLVDASARPAVDLPEQRSHKPVTAITEGKVLHMRRDGKAYSPNVAASSKIVLPCASCSTEVTGMQSMSHHLYRKHRLSVGSNYTRTLLGDTCPLCLKVDPPKTHSMREHEVEGGMPALFVEAMQQGDPHGVVTRQHEAIRTWIKAGRVLNVDHVMSSLRTAVGR